MAAEVKSATHHKHSCLNCQGQRHTAPANGRFQIMRDLVNDYINFQADQVKQIALRIQLAQFDKDPTARNFKALTHAFEQVSGIKVNEKKPSKEKKIDSAIDRFQSLIESKKPSEVEAELNQIKDEDIQQAVLEEVIIDYYFKNAPEHAERFIEKIEDEQSRELYYLDLAWSFCNLEKTKRALAILKKHVKTNGGKAVTYFDLSSTYNKMSKKQKNPDELMPIALEMYLKIPEEYRYAEQMATLFKNKVSSMQTHLQYQAELGQYCERIGKPFDNLDDSFQHLALECFNEYIRIASIYRQEEDKDRKLELTQKGESNLLKASLCARSVSNPNLRSYLQMVSAYYNLDLEAALFNLNQIANAKAKKYALKKLINILLPLNEIHQSKFFKGSTKQKCDSFLEIINLLRKKQLAPEHLEKIQDPILKAELEARIKEEKAE